jgi:hypothetical protein
MARCWSKVKRTAQGGAISFQPEVFLPGAILLSRGTRSVSSSRFFRTESQCHDKSRVRQGASPTVLSHLEIGGDKRISQHLSSSVPPANASLTIIAPSRTPLWLPSGWECRVSVFPQRKEILIRGAGCCPAWFLTRKERQPEEARIGALARFQSEVLLFRQGASQGTGQTEVIQNRLRRKLKIAPARPSN